MSVIDFVVAWPRFVRDGGYIDLLILVEGRRYIPCIYLR